MRNQRPLFRVASLLILLSLCSIRIGGAVANPVYPDQESISNGAQLYELYCSDCHGRDTTSSYSPMYEPAASSADKYPELVDLAQRQEDAEENAPKDTDLPMATVKVPWPEWADRPDPDAEEPPDSKLETVAELNALIDDAHGITSGPEADKKTDEEPAASAGFKFEPVPGATNLADPTTYFYGTSEQEMFNSIANGTGSTMVGWRSELGNANAIWDVVNYLRSFWGDEWQN